MFITLAFFGSAFEQKGARKKRGAGDWSYGMVGSKDNEMISASW